MRETVGVAELNMENCGVTNPRDRWAACHVCNVVTCNVVTRVISSRVTCVMLSRVMLSRGRNTETWIEKAQNFFEGKQVY